MSPCKFIVMGQPGRFVVSPEWNYDATSFKDAMNNSIRKEDNFLLYGEDLACIMNLSFDAVDVLSNHDIEVYVDNEEINAVYVFRKGEEVPFYSSRNQSDASAWLEDFALRLEWKNKTVSIYDVLCKIREHFGELDNDSGAYTWDGQWLSVAKVCDAIKELSE